MDKRPVDNGVEPGHRSVTFGVICSQYLLGLFSHLLFALPYLRRAPGRERLRRSQRYLFVCNHVSLLDTILLGALCWRTGCYPILVLGDKSVWHASRLRKFLSDRVGFLLERSKRSLNRIEELQKFGHAGRQFHLVVFPEGTRGDGIQVQTCQPGIYYVAQEAQLPLVPVFIKNMQLVSTKTGPLHLFRGLRKVEFHFGEIIPPEKYLPLPREEFLELVRQSIVSARS